MKVVIFIGFVWVRVRSRLWCTVECLVIPGTLFSTFSLFSCMDM